MSIDAHSILYSYGDSKLAKSIIRFIDIILTLHSPLPFHLRNEMLILQNTLQPNHKRTLDEYLDHLENKLNTKAKSKQVDQAIVDGCMSSGTQISEIKTCRNMGWDVDK
jgi:hypothetical protein